MYSIIALLISIILFFILRPVFLWYWKVDKILENLNEQLEIMRIAFKDKIDESIKERLQLETAEINQFMNADIDYSVPGGLTKEERETIILKSSNLKSGQLLTYDSFTKRIESWVKDDYMKFQQREKRESLTVVAVKK